jgi:thioredoxin-related protein
VRMRILWILWLFCFLFGVGILSSQVLARTSPGQAKAKIYDQSSDSSKQIADALALAKKENKRVLLEFGVNWCEWCQKLYKLFKNDKRIATKLKNSYVVVMIDIEQGNNADINRKYGNPIRFGSPAIVILNADGKQLTTKDTGELEQGKGYNPKKILDFLEEWEFKN